MQKNSILETVGKALLTKLGRRIVEDGKGAGEWNVEEWTSQKDHHHISQKKRRAEYSIQG